MVKLLNENLKDLVGMCPIEKIKLYDDNLTVEVKAEHLCNLLLFFRYHISYQFEVLTCISGVDYPQNKYRFKVIYDLLSVRYNARIRVETYAYELLSLDSCSYIYPAGNWYECEVWDMYGVFFNNHPNLKRILTDYGFEGHPLRKDFPLTGYVEMRYNEIEKRVVHESIELCQEYREFSFLSPWKSKDK